MPEQNKTGINKYGILLLFSSILLGSAAQLMIKLGMNILPSDLNSSMDIPWASLFWIVSGLAGYAVSMLIWMMALANYELSFAYPMLSISYILVYIGAVAIPQLNETVSINKSIGIMLIIAGVIFVTRSESKT